MLQKNHKQMLQTVGKSKEPTFQIHSFPNLPDHGWNLQGIGLSRQSAGSVMDPERWRDSAVKCYKGGPLRQILVSHKPLKHELVNSEDSERSMSA